MEVDTEKSASSVTSNKNDPNGTENPGGKAEEIIKLQDLDPAMHKKMHLVNNVSHKSFTNALTIIANCYQALDEIGWTGYHWKLFALSGFG